MKRSLAFVLLVAGLTGAAASDQPAAILEFETEAPHFAAVSRAMAARLERIGLPVSALREDPPIHLSVAVPNRHAPERVARLLSAQGHLAFHGVAEGAACPASHSGVRCLADAAGTVYPLDPTALLTGDIVAEASAGAPSGFPGVSVNLTAEAAAAFCTLTGENIGRSLAVVADGQILIAPVIQEAICGGGIVISGNFTKEEAARLADALTGPPYPAPVRLIAVTGGAPQGVSWGEFLGILGEGLAKP